MQVELNSAIAAKHGCNLVTFVCAGVSVPACCATLFKLQVTCACQFRVTLYQQVNETDGFGPAKRPAESPWQRNLGSWMQQARTMQIQLIHAVAAEVAKTAICAIMAYALSLFAIFTPIGLSSQRTTLIQRTEESSGLRKGITRSRNCRPQLSTYSSFDER